MPDKTILIYAVGAQGPQGPAGQDGGSSSPDIQPMPLETTAYTVGEHPNREWLVGNDNLSISLPDPMTFAGNLQLGYTESFVRVFGPGGPDANIIVVAPLNGNADMISLKGERLLGIGARMVCELIIIEDTRLTWLVSGDVEFVS